MHLGTTNPYLVPILLAIVLGLNTTTAAQSTDAQSNQPLQQFELRVVDQNGRPVPGASVEIRSRPKIDPSAVTLGAVQSSNAYGVKVLADSQGTLRLSGGQLPGYLALNIQPDGFAPYWAEFDRDRRGHSLPASFTASVESAWSIGGVVLDAGGRPVVGADVRPRVDFRKRAGDLESLGVGTVVATDDDGRWSYHHVPVSKTEVHVTINHPEYQAYRANLTRQQFEETSASPSQGTITLTQGFTLAGFVRDEVGAAIEGATVRTKFFNEIRESTTDEFGRYQITGCEERLVRVVAFAKGRALEMKEVRIGPGIDPVDFVLPPGGRVRVRVVDSEGKGLPKARIFLQRWRGHVDYFEFDHVDCYTDENGVWEWNEAPLDAFQADICPKGGMQMTDQVIVAREKEFVFQPPARLIVTGNVVDAESDEPVTNFRVTPGRRNPDIGIGIDWYKRDSHVSQTSDYRVVFDRSSVGYIVRIEADGFRVAQSRDFESGEGDVTYDFRLEKAESLSGQTLDSEGRPAAGAKIAIATKDAQIIIDDGEIDESSTYASRLDTDADGRFRIPVRDEAFHLVIVHEQGHAFVFSESIGTDETIRLKPWSTLEGKFRVGTQPGKNIRLSINGGIFEPVQGDAGRVYASAGTTTDEQGNYRHERLFDGRGAIGREIVMMVDDGATEVTSSLTVPFLIAPGESLKLNLGGTGRVVTGRLQVPDDFRAKVVWSFATVDVVPRLVNPIPPVDAKVRDDPKEWRAWLGTDAGIRFVANIEAYQRQRAMTVRYRATVNHDGVFRIDDVPPGRYELDAELGNNQNGSIREYKFEIADRKADVENAAEMTAQNDPLDLGWIVLE